MHASLNSYSISNRCSIFTEYIHVPPHWLQLIIYVSECVIIWHYVEHTVQDISWNIRRLLSNLPISQYHNYNWILKIKIFHELLLACRIDWDIFFFNYKYPNDVPLIKRVTLSPMITYLYSSWFRICFNALLTRCMYKNSDIPHNGSLRSNLLSAWLWRLPPTNFIVFNVQDNMLLKEVWMLLTPPPPPIGCDVHYFVSKWIISMFISTLLLLVLQ